MKTNPWLTIWFNPKEAYRQVLENQKSRDSFLLCFVAGLRLVIMAWIIEISFLNYFTEPSDPIFARPITEWIRWTEFIVPLLSIWPIGYLMSYFFTLLFWANSKIFLKTKKSFQNYRLIILWNFAFNLPILPFSIAREFAFNLPPLPFTITQESSEKIIGYSIIATLLISFFAIRSIFYGISLLENISKWRAFGILFITLIIYFLLNLILPHFFNFIFFSVL